ASTGLELDEVMGLIISAVPKLGIITPPKVLEPGGGLAKPFFAIWLIHTWGVTRNDHASPVSADARACTPRLQITTVTTTMTSDKGTADLVMHSCCLEE